MRTSKLIHGAQKVYADWVSSEALVGQAGKHIRHDHINGAGMNFCI
jgi:hypothetical protein